MHGLAFTLGRLLSLRVPTNVVYERALNRWQRVMPLEMLWFTDVLGGKEKLTRVVICDGLSKNLVIIRKKVSLLIDK
jgi:hypothetical protein